MAELKKSAIKKAIRSIEKSYDYHSYNGKYDVLVDLDELVDLIANMSISTTTEAEIRASAIDEFAEKLKWELGQLIFPDSEKFAYPVKEQEQICHQNMTLKNAIRLVDYFAEQLKEE